MGRRVEMTAAFADYRIKDDSEYQRRLEIESRGIVTDYPVKTPDEHDQQEAEKLAVLWREGDKSTSGGKQGTRVMPALERACFVCGKMCVPPKSSRNAFCSDKCKSIRKAETRRNAWRNQNAKRQRSN